jgi:hypothetical protein
VNEQLSIFIDRAIAEGWKVETLLRRVNNEIGHDGEPVSVGEAANALRERGYRDTVNGIRKAGEWAFSEETREKLLQLAAAGAHMDELFDAPGADVDDPTNFVEAQGYTFDDDDCCVTVGVPRPAATEPKPKAAAVREAKTPTPDARVKKKAKLADDGLPNAITVRLAGLDIRHVPGYPRVCVTADQVAFVRENSRRLGDHIRLLPRKRDPRTGRESWVLGMGARHKRVYLNVSKVMYNCGFWCPVPKDKRRKRAPLV